ncbi:MAG: 16S rRNA (guanine(527)-N(7))-methyltransferase RsmG [Oscillospiraceae bacterium]
MTICKDLLLETTKDFNIILTDEILEKLDIYADILIETNKHLNLTAITEPSEVTVKHFADSLSLFKYVDFPTNSSVIDVGTGAGFPGVVLLIVRPDLKITFLDGTKKKLTFIETVLKELNLNAEIVHARAEEAGQNSIYREKFDFATARAVSNLTNLSEYCLPFVKVSGSLIAMKSISTDEEIDAAKKAVKLLGGEISENIMFDLVEKTPRRILTIKKISQTPSIYPRPSAKIAKNPLK